MKKDIDFRLVEGVALAVAATPTELGDLAWNVYLLNHNSFPLSTVLVASRGYGEVEGAEVKTSVLRHMFEQVAANSFVQIEPIDPALFHINNEYWVSYYVGNQLYDKKFVFVTDSITPANFSQISMLNLKGVLHS